MQGRMTGLAHVRQQTQLFHTVASRVSLRSRSRQNVTVVVPRKRRVHVTKAVIQSTAVAARLAHRIAVQYALPGRLLLTTASRAAGLRAAMVGLSLYGVVLTTWAILANKFGWTDRVSRTIEDKNRLDDKIRDLESVQEKESMLRLVLAHTKEALSSIDEDDSDVSGDVNVLVSMDGRKPCPVCGGTGRISYEAKFLHRDAPCPRCLGRGSLE